MTPTEFIFWHAGRHCRRIPIDTVALVVVARAGVETLEVCRELDELDQAIEVATTKRREAERIGFVLPRTGATFDYEKRGG